MTSYIETGTILDRILARTTKDVADRNMATPLNTLERLTADRPSPVSLVAALSGPGIALIAEYKRASPSKGRFAFEATPAEVARQYFDGAAAAMSVLTDKPFFQGSLQDMQEAAVVAHSLSERRPVLRKDFVIDKYQILEALAFGADAVLLIVAALEQPVLERLLAAATDSGIDALVEVHDALELERAQSAGASLIGINNRNLHTFDVDLAVTERLAGLAATTALVVSESGIFTAADVQRVQAAGANAILVGESLITAPDRAGAVQALLTDQCPPHAGQPS